MNMKKVLLLTIVASVFSLLFVTGGRAQLLSSHGIGQPLGTNSTDTRNEDMTPTEDETTLLQQAGAKAQQKDFDGADKIIDQLLKKHPDDKSARAFRATFKLFRGNPDGAIADLNELVNQYPGENDLLIIRSTAKLWKNDSVGALGDIDKAMKGSPTSMRLSIFYSCWAVVKTNNADIAGAKVDYWIARKLWDEVSAQYPESSLSQSTAALDALGEQLKADPADRTSTTAQEDILAAERGHPALLAAIKKMGKRDAESIRCFNNLKQIYLAMSVWADDHDNTFPRDFFSIREQLGSPRPLICPSDGRISTLENLTWDNLDPDKISYKMVSPGLEKYSPDTFEKVLVRCPFHGHVIMGDGTVREDGQVATP